MSTSLALQCTCGLVKGAVQVRPDRPGNRLVNMFARAANSVADLDTIQGPVQQRIYRRHAIGEQGILDAHDTMPASLIACTLWRLLQRRLRGEHHRSPFFDESGQPIVALHVLEHGEHAVSEAR